MSYSKLAGPRARHTEPDEPLRVHMADDGHVVWHGTHEEAVALRDTVVRWCAQQGACITNDYIADYCHAHTILDSQRRLDYWLGEIRTGAPLPWNLEEALRPEERPKPARAKRTAMGSLTIIEATGKAISQSFSIKTCPHRPVTISLDNSGMHVSECPHQRND